MTGRVNRVGPVASHDYPRVARGLRAIVGDDHVADALGELLPFANDATPLISVPPDLVVSPATTEEVAAILRMADSAGIPVTPRGAGTNLCGGAVPLYGGIVLSLNRFSTIFEISPAELLAVSQPGVTTSELASACAAHGLLYVPDPGSRSVSTIGGNIATCAGGLRGLKYGVTRNYVLGLEVVLASGDVIRTGGRLWKDVAGYDLTRLITGSEGTLGVITEATLALLPMPEFSSVGIAYFPSLRQAGRAVDTIIRSGVIPSTLEFLDNKCVNAVEDFARLGLNREAGALLLFGDDGAQSVVRDVVQAMSAKCAEAGAIEVTTAMTDEEAEALLAARRCTLPALTRRGSLTILEDIGVPRPLIADMVDTIRAVGEEHDLDFATFGHAGDGNLHPTCLIDATDEAAADRAIQAFARIFRTAIRLGGTITGEHGVGVAKLPYLSERLGPHQVELLGRIKRAFDPNTILNPGKLGS
jgi:glycolate oxidase